MKLDRPLGMQKVDSGFDWFRFHMDDRARCGREIQDRIGRILYEDWDPLNLRGVAPPDEYGSYVGGVYRLLASGATGEQVAEYLAELERGPFGYPDATAARNMVAARKLCELWLGTPDDRYLYATAAADGPAKGMRSKRLNPACPHHPRKSAPV